MFFHKRHVFTQRVYYIILYNVTQSYETTQYFALIYKEFIEEFSILHGATNFHWSAYFLTRIV